MPIFVIIKVFMVAVRGHSILKNPLLAIEDLEKKLGLSFQCVFFTHYLFRMAILIVVLNNF